MVVNLVKLLVINGSSIDFNLEGANARAGDGKGNGVVTEG